MRFAMIAFMHAFSESNTRAGPVIRGDFSPVIFATQPSGARLPFRIARWPCAYSGFDHGPDHVLVRARSFRDALQLLGERAPGDRHAIAVQQAVLEQHLEHLRHAARAVEIDRDVASRGLEIAEHRHLPAHALEVVDRPFDARRVRDGEVVQDGVRRAAGRHDERHRVLDRLARDDVARLQVVLDRCDEHAGRGGRRVRFLGVGRRELRRAEQAHAERFERGRHRVRGVHPAARADAWDTRSSRSRRNPLRSCGPRRRRRRLRTRSRW